MTHWDRFAFDDWKTNGCPINTEVVELCLSSNSLYSKKEPAILKNLPNVKILDISNNNFKIFPIEICDLINLESLDVSTNCITKIPNWFQNLKNLIYFNSDKNQINCKYL
jgi:Leucine-rich repeat (LRR) protein